MRGPTTEVIKAYEKFIRQLDDRRLQAKNRKTRLASSLIEYVEEKFSIDGGPSAKFKTTISRSTPVPNSA